MAVTKRFYLNCPYAEKNQAKDFGARWDNDAKKRYVPNDVDRNLFKKWWPKHLGEESVEDADNFCDAG